MGKVRKQVSFHPNLWPPSAKSSAPCACSEPWVHFRENLTKQKRNALSSFAAVIPRRKRGCLGRKTVKSKAVEHILAAEAPDEKRAIYSRQQIRQFHLQYFQGHRTGTCSQNLAILASRNDVVEKLNVPIQKQLLGQEYAYKSIDCILNDDEAVQHPIEFLNSIQTLDLQVHNLILKVGATIILIRNIDAPRLCRVIMKQLMQHVIQATVLT
ncbi:ATP-dependent DNA helicase [Trichonephila clavipes]|nr:ATP-dependent DNA helicase [Trichonephila clavipes]